jgi:spore maturation protein CgeB
VALEGIEATHGKQVLVADEAEKMIMLLKALVENIEKYNLVADNAYEFVKQYYDNKVLIQRLIEYYKNLAN